MNLKIGGIGGFMKKAKKKRKKPTLLKKIKVKPKRKPKK
jgi:hypothetical protein